MTTSCLLVIVSHFKLHLFFRWWELNTAVEDYVLQRGALLVMFAALPYYAVSVSHMHHPSTPLPAALQQNVNYWNAVAPQSSQLVFVVHLIWNPLDMYLTTSSLESENPLPQLGGHLEWSESMKLQQGAVAGQCSWWSIEKRPCHFDQNWKKVWPDN